MSLIVSNPGFATIHVDEGRYGAMANGFCNSGPADALSFRWNAALLGNSFSMTQLELRKGNLSAEITKECSITLTGFGCDLLLNDKVKPGWTIHRVHQGDFLFFRPNKSGDFSYLGIEGGFKADEFLGSRSDCPRLGIGRKIESGMVLSSDNTKAESNVEKPSGFGLKRKFIPSLPIEVFECRFFPGAQYAKFPVESRKVFEKEEYTLGHRKDRMGIRLEGSGVTWGGKDLYSEGVMPGTIQIPADGQPFVLGPDAQTIGGYPKMGVVFSLDLSILIQLQPGSKVRFKPVDSTQVFSELVSLDRELAEYKF